MVTSGLNPGTSMNQQNWGATILHLYMIHFTYVQGSDPS